jgi:hypothetical protein
MTMTANIPNATQKQTNTNTQNNRQRRRLPTRIEAHLMLRDMAFVLKMTEFVRNEILAGASNDDLAAAIK